VTDVTVALQREFGNGVTFIHEEVYAHNQPKSGLRAQMKAFHLETEPWLFVINRRDHHRTARGGLRDHRAGRRAESGAAMRGYAPRSALGLTLLIVAAAALAGCGSSSGGGLTVPKIAAARVFTLGGFAPTGSIGPEPATTMSFTVNLPSGKPLTTYKTGPGPHTGVHLIIVRDDLASPSTATRPPLRHTPEPYAPSVTVTTLPDLEQAALSVAPG
jgi:hypothetical protein